MKDSEVLKRAKKYIRNDKVRYVCFAISLARSDEKMFGLQCDLTTWIEHMLGDRDTYWDWLADRGHKTNRDSVKSGQLAWLDWMIDYCENEEKTK